MKFLLPTWIALVLGASAASAQLVAPGSNWKYLDDGSDQGTNWTGVNFDDSMWASGPAKLGYGDGDENTVIGFGPDPDDKYVTTYFRHSFQVANVLDINHLALGVLRDDGVVVYLNGHRLMRNNLPAGNPHHLMYAEQEIDYPAEGKWIWKSLSPSYLVTGTNVLAIEIHQASPASADLGFDCTLDANKLVERGMLWKYLDDGSDQGMAWTQPSFDDSAWNKGPAELGYGDYDEMTMLGYGDNPSDKHPTTYFRGEFEIVNPQLITDLTMGVLRDDGAIVFLNGTEIWRNNMPTGAVNYRTYADTDVDGSGEWEWKWSLVDPALLVAGTNVLAVEIHQFDAFSLDISFNLELSPRPFEHLVRKPYLQNSSENGTVLRWRTAYPESSLVEYGVVPGSLTQSVYDPTPTTEHEIELTNLATDTTYYYAVGSDTEVRAGGDGEHFFATFPASGQPAATRVWVLGDSGTASPIQIGVRDAYLSWTGTDATDLILLLGDNAYNDGTDFEYQTKYFEIYADSIRQIPAYSTRGNHERDETAYYDNFTLPTAGEAGGLASGSEAYYSFDYGNIHFVCLDSYETSRLTSDPMYLWLENDLASTNQEWIIAFWHHPPYSKGSHDSDSPTDSEGRMTEMRERFLPLLESYGVDLVLSGHSHSYERSFLIDGHYDISLTWNPSLMLVDAGDGSESGNGAYVKPIAGNAGTVYTVAGSSGKVSGGSLDHPAMHTSLPYAGSVALDIFDDRLDLNFIDDTGTVADCFTMRKHRSGPFLDIRNLTAGSAVTATVSNLTSGNLTYLGFSLAGPGPTMTPLGVVQLSQPIGHIGPLPADANGEVQIVQSLPLGLAGAVVFTQAIEVVTPGVRFISNARADVVQ